MGRLFDAVAAFLGLRMRVTYEGQAAIELEAICSPSAMGDSPYPVVLNATEFDVTPMWRAMVVDMRAHVDRAQMSTRFHRTMAEVIRHYSCRAREELGLETVVLTGGVFQNVYLLKAACELLTQDGFRVLTHRVVPPNDGGIALGQAAILTSPGA